MAICQSRFSRVCVCVSVGTAESGGGGTAASCRSSKAPSLLEYSVESVRQTLINRDSPTNANIMHALRPRSGASLAAARRQRSCQRVFAACGMLVVVWLLLRSGRAPGVVVPVAPVSPPIVDMRPQEDAAAASTAARDAGAGAADASSPPPEVHRNDDDDPPAASSGVAFVAKPLPIVSLYSTFVDRFVRVDSDGALHADAAYPWSESTWFRVVRLTANFTVAPPVMLPAVSGGGGRRLQASDVPTEAALARAVLDLEDAMRAAPGAAAAHDATAFDSPSSATSAAAAAASSAAAAGALETSADDEELKAELWQARARARACAWACA